MQKEKLIELIKNPFAIQKEDMPELQQLVKDYPYFQSAHLLLNIAAKKWDVSFYNQSLTKAAIVLPNRKHFYNLTNSGTYKTQTKAVTESEEVIRDEKLKTETISKEEVKILQTIENLIEEKNTTHETQKAIEPKSELNKESLQIEIAKQVVASFVDKEIINKPSLPKEELPAAANFSDWLQVLKNKNATKENNLSKGKEEEIEEESSVSDFWLMAKEIQSKAIERKEKNKSLIDKIIEQNPGHIKLKEEQKFYAPDSKAKESLLENEDLVTETLAKIYAMQGNVNKAIRAYQILSLKFPQKSVYFAALIKNLKNNS